MKIEETENVIALLRPAHFPPDMQGWGNGYVGAK
jgi:hypothetical protein